MKDMICKPGEYLHELEEQSWDNAYDIDRRDIRNSRPETVDKPKDESQVELGVDDVEIVC